MSLDVHTINVQLEFRVHYFIIGEVTKFWNLHSSRSGYVLDANNFGTIFEKPKFLLNEIT